MLCQGWRASATALPVVFVTVLLPTGSGSARSDGTCDLSRHFSTSPEAEDSKVIVLVDDICL